MCDEGKDRFWGGGVLRNYLAEKWAAGQISLRSTALDSCAPFEVKLIKRPPARWMT